MATIYKNGTQLVDEKGTALGTDAMNTALKGANYNLDTFQNYTGSGSISSQNLQSNGSPIIPPPKVDTTNYPGIITGAASGVTTTPNTTPDTTYTDKSKALLDSILQGSTDLTGKTAYAQQQLDASGATAIQKRQNELAAQITALNNENQAIPLQAQENATGRGITTSGLQTSTITPNLRANAIKALSINSEYALNAGNLQTAQETAQRAVDLKYKDTEDQLTRNTQLLQLYTPFMNAEQKDIADAKNLKNQADLTALSDKKKSQTDIINAAQQSGQSDVAADALKLDPNSPTFVNDLATLQGKISNPNTALDTQLKKLQISQAALNLQKTTADIKKLNSQINDQGDTVSTLAQQLISGNLAPSELSKRATGAGAYNDVLTAADKISMETTGKHFNISKANIDYKFAQQPNTQNTLKYLGSLVGGVGQTGNLDALVNLSNSIDRSNFPKLSDTEQWLKLETGNAPIAAYHATLLEVSDQIAKILQGGSTGGTSDAKLAQANSLFQTGFNKDQVTAVANALKPLLQNRANNIIGNNPYLSDFAEQFGTNLPKTSDLLSSPIPGGTTGAQSSGFDWSKAPTL